MSESVFVILCEIIGNSTQMAIRRETCDIREVLNRRVAANDGVIGMLSGSFREGFRLNGSERLYVMSKQPPSDHGHLSV